MLLRASGTSYPSPRSYFDTPYLSLSDCSPARGVIESLTVSLAPPPSALEVTTVRRSSGRSIENNRASRNQTVMDSQSVMMVRVGLNSKKPLESKAGAHFTGG